MAVLLGLVAALLTAKAAHKPKPPPPPPAEVTTVSMFVGERVFVRPTCTVKSLSKLPPDVKSTLTPDGALFLVAKSKRAAKVTVNCEEKTKKAKVVLDLTVEKMDETRPPNLPEKLELMLGETRIFRLPCQLARIPVGGASNVQYTPLHWQNIQLDAVSGGKHSDFMWCVDGKRVAIDTVVKTH